MVIFCTLIISNPRVIFAPLEADKTKKKYISKYCIWLFHGIVERVFYIHTFDQLFNIQLTRLDLKCFLLHLPYVLKKQAVENKKHLYIHKSQCLHAGIARTLKFL